MAAIPYLWYWIIGSLVAVLIATVAIFSENLVEKNIASKVEENKEISTEKENPSQGGEDQSAVDQQKTVVQEPTVADDKVEGDLEAKEDEVATEKPSDNQTLETKSSAYPPSLETARVDDDGTALVAGSAYPGSTLEILVDETFGLQVQEKAKEMGIKFAAPVEKSGQKIFDFEYGSDFGEKIKEVK